jgi:hypothetical protein
MSVLARILDPRLRVDGDPSNRISLLADSLLSRMPRRSPGLDKARLYGGFLLEQDNVLAADAARGSGPIHDARSSVQLLRSAFAGATDVGAS